MRYLVHSIFPVATAALFCFAPEALVLGPGVAEADTPLTSVVVVTTVTTAATELPDIVEPGIVFAGSVVGDRDVTACTLRTIEFEICVEIVMGNKMVSETTAPAMVVGDMV